MSLCVPFYYKACSLLLRLKKEKATAVLELTHLLQVRSQIDILCASVAPQSTNSLQEQYLEISESIDLHRKARAALNKDRVRVT